jgi:hypothetical protein
MHGPDFDHDFGIDVQSIGDIDGDGVRDLLVAAPSSAVWVLGNVYLLSGRDGHELRRIVGELSLYGDPPIPKVGSYCFGGNVCPLPDVDGDSVDDYAIADPGMCPPDGWPPCAIWVFSGSSGKMLHRFRKNSVEQLGLRMQRGGDLDGDGVCDLLALGGGSAPEYVEAYSMRSGALLYHSALPHSQSFAWNWVLRSTDDVDRDGVREILAGFAELQGEHETVLSLLSGRNGAPFSDYTSEQLAKLAGESDASWVLGDIDEDGVLDTVSFREVKGSDGELSTLTVRSGSDGTSLTSLTVDGIGTIAPIGHIDRDHSFVIAVNQVHDTVRAYEIRPVSLRSARQK